jgi:hypothetical protein
MAAWQSDTIRAIAPAIAWLRASEPFRGFRTATVATPHTAHASQSNVKCNRPTQKSEIMLDPSQGTGEDR